MHRIYNWETDEPMFFPGFETLDAWEEYLDDIAEAWDPYEEDEDGNIVYECTMDGETVIYLIAILEA